MRTAIISGASKGIGAAAARSFAQNGYRVLNLSRTKSIAPDVENRLIDLGSADDDEVKAALKDVKAGEVVIVHNAAFMSKDSAKDCEANLLQKALQVNVVAPQMINRALIGAGPYGNSRMRAGSSVLFVGSTLATQAVPSAFSYVTSKHAMIGMMRALCQDLIGTGIHTCCVCPGFTDTEMLRAHVGDDPETLQNIAEISTFARLIEPCEIADTLLFAAKNPVINGSIIHANLGQVGY